MKEILSKYENFCEGWKGEGKFISSPFISISETDPLDKKGNGLLNEILSFDSAEIETTYFGQVNLVKITSFCSPEGYIWGYDLAKVDMREIKELTAKYKSKILEANKLEKATIELLGTNKYKRFRIFPGSIVYCAFNFKIFPENKIAYGTIGIGIPQDRENQACLIMEDVGIRKIKESSSIAKENMIKSIIKIGKEHRIKYREILIMYKEKRISKGKIACVLAAVPFLKIAQKAFLSNIFDLSLEEWKRKVNL